MLRCEYTMYAHYFGFGPFEWYPNAMETCRATETLGRGRAEIQMVVWGVVS